MNGFGLLIGHMVGDYVLQNDFQALGKTTNSWVCALHCTLYTFAVWLFSFWWLPWWCLVVCWLAHFPVDRWRLARKWMTLAGQEKFATGPLSPWSIVVVDNCLHLTVLFALGQAA